MANNLFENFDSRDAFKICLVLFDNINSCFFDDYPITENISNHQFAHTYICKTNYAKLASNLRGHLKFMKSLMTKKDTDFEKIKSRRKKLSDWHDFLTQQHMWHYSRNTAETWNYFGLALHYLVDAYYHIYTKFFSTSSRAVCFWCRESLHKRWSQILSDIVIGHLPKAYLYMCLAQNCDLEKRPVTLKLINDYFDDVGLLMRESIK